MDSPGGAAASNQYALAQEEELEVLKAIYMEDFHEIEHKSAWSRSSEKAFTLALKAFSDPLTSALLSVRFPATYPKTSPVLRVEHMNGLHKRIASRIQDVIASKLKELRGEVLVHTVASDIQDALEDAVQARESGVLPDLGTERAVNEAVATAEAQAKERAASERLRLARLAEDDAFQKRVAEEMQRQGPRSQDTTLVTRLTGGSTMEVGQTLSFDQQCHIPVGSSQVTVRSIALLARINRSGSSGGWSELFMARSQEAGDLVLAVRQARIKVAAISARRTDISNLEKDLDSLKSVTHSNILKVHGYQIERSDVDQDWCVSILTDFANRGSLDELCQDGQTIPARKARLWFLSLLEALNQFHTQGIIHRSISARNVLLSNSTNQGTVPLLADAAYSWRLHEMYTLCNARSRPASIEGQTPSKWLAPETQTATPSYSTKSDVFALGVVLLQMLFGSQVVSEYTSPSHLLQSLPLSEPLYDLLNNMFKQDPNRRPTAYALIPSQFLREDAPVLQHSQTSDSLRKTQPVNPALPEAASRYTKDFLEICRLGSGGFGSVYKTRNKTDGGVYAVKKIQQDSIARLEQVLSEVMVLARLNHAYIVRYYTAWVEIEDIAAGSVLEATDTTTASSFDPSSTIQDSLNLDFGSSSRGLDFVSSNGYNAIQFGFDSDDDENYGASQGVASSSEDDDEVSEALEPPVPRARLASRSSTRSILFIQMEFCERRTLRDLILDGLSSDSIWRLLRQICAGLSHIHAHGIIHRDLKPENVFIDTAGSIKIGDFGLATLNRSHVKPTGSRTTEGDGMTRSVGTALYVAPELQSGAASLYDEKVDMYSLGIILFEMCSRFETGMERLKTLGELRKPQYSLPPSFQTRDRHELGAIVQLLVQHAPADRPRSIELLRSGKIPLDAEDDTIQQALRSLSDGRSPYHHQVLAALFAQSKEQRIRDYAWEARDHEGKIESHEQPRASAIARSLLTAIFRRHGAEELRPPSLLPRSQYSSAPDVAQLLDPSGCIVQLAYDSTLPQARQLARRGPSPKKRFIFGEVYRSAGNGGPPRSSGVVDFTIASHDAEFAQVEEAETLKVLDEIIVGTAALRTLPMSFQVNHHDLLELILDHVGIDASQRPSVLEVLSKLNFGRWTWSKIKSELRSTLGISALSLDTMAQFDFRDTPVRAIARMQMLFEDSRHVERLAVIADHFLCLTKLLSSLEVHRAVYVSPLTSYNAKYFTDGLLLQCVHDGKTRSVFAAGGRYDALIESLRGSGHNMASTRSRAVGISIAMDSLLREMLRHGRQDTSRRTGVPESIVTGAEKRCEVLVTSLDAELLPTAGSGLLAQLWANDISAELGIESHDMDEFEYNWIVTIKHEAANSYKVRNTIAGSENSNIDVDIPAVDLITHLRDQRPARTGPWPHNHHNMNMHPPSMRRQTSHHNNNNPEPGDASRSSNVKVLMSQHKSRKSNKFDIINAARQHWSDKIDEWKSEAPILAIETRDDVLSLLRETRLSDPDSWRKAAQRVPLNERVYFGQIQDWLGEARDGWRSGDGIREACVYNFRTRASVLYDLGL